MQYSQHPALDEYLETKPDSTTKTSRKNHCGIFKSLNECDLINGSIKNTLVLFISTFNALFKKKKLIEPEEDCIRNIIKFVDLILIKDCEIDFTDEEIDRMLDSLATIDLKYYNILTINMYTIIFRSLSKKIGTNTFPWVYTHKMTEKLAKVRIFFTDSYIFGNNYLSYASLKLKVEDISSSEPNAIYPIQLDKMGLDKNFASYFLYAHFLYSKILSLVSELIIRPFDEKKMREFIYLFPLVMEKYVFIKDNITIATLIDMDQIRYPSDIYAPHGMPLSSAKIVLALTIIFITELQYIFFGEYDKFNCSKVSEIICKIFKADANVCRDYLVLFKFNEKSASNELLNEKLSEGFGTYSYGLMENYYQNGWKPDSNGKNDEIQFVESLEFIKKKDPNFGKKICRTIHYLKAIDTKCLSTKENIIELFTTGEKTKNSLDEIC